MRLQLRCLLKRVCALSSRELDLLRVSNGFFLAKNSPWRFFILIAKQRANCLDLFAVD